MSARGVSEIARLLDLDLQLARTLATRVVNENWFSWLSVPSAVVVQPENPNRTFLLGENRTLPRGAYTACRAQVEASAFDVNEFMSSS